MLEWTRKEKMGRKLVSTHCLEYGACITALRNWDTRVEGDAMLLGVIQSANRTKEYIRQYTSLEFLELCGIRYLLRSLPHERHERVARSVIVAFPTSVIRQVMVQRFALTISLY